MLLPGVTRNSPGGSTPILGYTKDVRPEWVSFRGQKSADGCKFPPKNLRMSHNFNSSIEHGVPGHFPILCLR